MAFGLVMALTACATTTEEVDPNTPEACITIDNRQGGGTAGRIYLVSQSNERIRMGDVSMGRQERRCLRRTNFGGNWYLIVERPASDGIDPALRQNQARPIRSIDFFITAGDEIVWNVHLNRILLGGSGG